MARSREREIKPARRMANRFQIIRCWDISTGAASNEYVIKPAGYTTIIARVRLEHADNGARDLSDLMEAVQTICNVPCPASKRPVRRKSARRK